MCLCVCVCRDHIGFHRPKWHSITRKIRHLAESISRITSTGAEKLNEHFAGTTTISIVSGPRQKEKIKIKSCGLTKTPRPLPPAVYSSCALRLQNIPSYAREINSSPHTAQKEKEKKKKEERSKKEKRKKSKKSSPRCHYSLLSMPVTQI